MTDPCVRFETRRLAVRRAVPDDAAYIVRLWSDPRATQFAGFPNGIPTTAHGVLRSTERGCGASALLIAEERGSRSPIGQCLIGAADADGVSESDVKPDPAVWRRGYGTELWSALIDQVFLRATCDVVRGTSNVANLASIRMQESAGMKHVGRGV